MTSELSPKVNLKGLLLLVSLLLAALGCELLAPAGTPVSQRAAPTRRLRPTPVPTPTRGQPTPTPYPTPAPSLIDSDGDLFPDEVETAMGSDPFVNECLQQVGCGGTEIVMPSGIMNVIVVLDASAGMADEMPGGTKMDLAKAALSRYVESLPPSTSVGLVLYGHRGSADESGKAKSCAAVDLIYQVGPVDRVTLDARINSAPSVGWAPMADSLLAAQQAFIGRELQNNRILLVTSGGDTCGGDPCRVAKELGQSGVGTTMDVIGLHLDDAAAGSLQCVANTTGGLYYNARTSDELAEAWATLQQREKRWFETASCLARTKDVYMSCRRKQRERFTEWGRSSGWSRSHVNQWVDISNAITEEQIELTVPPTPVPTP